MHHLILVREFDQQMSGSGCCGRIGGDASEWAHNEASRVFPERRALMNRFGAVYRAVQVAFGDEVRITVIDPRNQLAFVPLVVRDMVRFRVPALTALGTLVSVGVSTGIFDGQMLFRGEVPEPQDVVERIRGRLVVHRVGDAEAPDEQTRYGS